MDKADIVCVTHDHMDHIGDSIQICKKTEATFVGIYELSVYAQEKGVRDTIGINIGGTADLRGIKVSMVQAFHSCTRGSPTGFIIRGEDKTIYHTGNMSLFGDMRLIGEIYHPDIALIPIGGYYTMGPKEAAEAVKLIRPAIVIPMHYQTFLVLTPTAEDFVRFINEEIPEVRVIVLKPGEAHQF